MHKTLERQIKKFIPDVKDLSKVEALIQAVDLTYKNFDEDRRLFDHSIEVSSKEFYQINNQLKESQKDLQFKVEDLQKTRKAILNLLEDIDDEKTKVEEKINERTRELFAEKQKLETILSSIGDGVIAVNVDCSVFLYNKKAEEILNYNADEIINKKLYDVIKLEAIDGRPLSVQERPISKAILGEFQSNVLLMTSKQGAKVPIALTVAPLRGSDNKVWGAISVFRDITKEKQAEQAKTDFLAIASHEMRTPLTIIKGKAERLLKKATGSDEHCAKDLMSIKNNSDRLLGIVNDFLDVILLEGGRVKFASQGVDIILVVKETIDELSVKAKDKNIALILNSDTTIPCIIIGDPSRIKQVILNIINNAINYTTKGSVSVEIVLTHETLIVRVIDTGIGIPIEKQKQLFQKFSNLSGSFMHSNEYGSGLGLYISHLLIQSMGGKIVLEKSSPGEGSTFAIYFKR